MLTQTQELSDTYPIRSGPQGEVRYEDSRFYFRDPRKGFILELNIQEKKFAPFLLEWRYKKELKETLVLNWGPRLGS